MEQKIYEALEALKQAAERQEDEKADSFRRGRIAFAEELMAFIQNAVAQEGQPGKQADLDVPTPRRRASPVHRAAVGIGAAAIAAVFADRQGLSISAIHQQAIERGHRLSIEGVGNELRRHEGTKYRRIGRQWFPVQNPGTEMAGAVLTDLNPAITQE